MPVATNKANHSPVVWEQFTRRYSVMFFNFYAKSPTELKLVVPPFERSNIQGEKKSWLKMFVNEVVQISIDYSSSILKGRVSCVRVDDFWCILIYFVGK